MTAFDYTKPFQTRDGRKTRLLASDVKSHRKLAVATLNPDGSERVDTYPADGCFYANRQDCSLDLINTPEGGNTRSKA